MQGKSQPDNSFGPTLPSGEVKWVIWIPSVGSTLENSASSLPGVLNLTWRDCWTLIYWPSGWCMVLTSCSEYSQPFWTTSVTCSLLQAYPSSLWLCFSACIYSKNNKTEICQHSNKNLNRQIHFELEPTSKTRIKERISQSQSQYSEWGASDLPQMHTSSSICSVYPLWSLCY